MPFMKHWSDDRESIDVLLPGGTVVLLDYESDRGLLLVFKPAESEREDLAAVFEAAAAEIRSAGG